MNPREELNQLKVLANEMDTRILALRDYLKESPSSSTFRKNAMVAEELRDGGHLLFTLQRVLEKARRVLTFTTDYYGEEDLNFDLALQPLEYAMEDVVEYAMEDNETE